MQQKILDAAKAKVAANKKAAKPKPDAGKKPAGETPPAPPAPPAPPPEPPPPPPAPEPPKPKPASKPKKLGYLEAAKLADKAARVAKKLQSEEQLTQVLDALDRVGDSYQTGQIYEALGGGYVPVGTPKKLVREFAERLGRAKIEDAKALADRAARWDAPLDYAQERPDHEVAREVAADGASRKVLEGLIASTPKEYREALDGHAVARARERSLWAELDAAKQAERDAAGWKPDPAQVVEDFEYSPRTRMLGAAWYAASSARDGHVAKLEEHRAEARDRLVESMRAERPMGVDFAHDEGVKEWDRDRIAAGKTHFIPPFEPNETQKKATDAAVAFLGSITEWGAGGPLKAKLRNSLDGRAYYNNDPGGADTIAFGHPSRPEGQATDTMVHEMGHAIEYRKPGVQDAVNRFLAYRLNGEPEVDMGTVPGGSSMKGEMVRKDKFDRHFDAVGAYYCGKQYYDTAKDAAGNEVKTQRKSTEVLSMGLEALYRDPVGFARDDPEYAQFVISMLRKKA